MPARPSSSIASALKPRAISSARYLQTTAPLPPPTSPLPPLATSSTSSSSSSSSSASASASTSKPTTSLLPPLLPAHLPSPLPTSPQSALSLLKSQSTPSSGRYITARLHSRTYLLHPTDILTVPTLKPLHPPGTTLALTRILEVGSRDWSIRSPAADGKTLRKQYLRKALAGEEGSLPAFGAGTPIFESLPEDMVRCDLTVLEHTKSPLQRIVKKKRRKGYKKTIQHKQGWTRLRVGDIILGGQGPEAEAASTLSS